MIWLLSGLFTLYRNQHRILISAKSTTADSQYPDWGEYFDDDRYERWETHKLSFVRDRNLMA
jgi:hypothetical protein